MTANRGDGVARAAGSAAPDGPRVLPVTGIGDVRPGDDLAALIAGAAPWLADGDVLVVTSKVISKAEHAPEDDAGNSDAENVIDRG